MLLSRGGELRAGAHDRRSRPERVEQTRRRLGAADEHVEAASRTELVGGDARKLLGCVGEGAEARVACGEAAQRRTRRSVRAEVERSPLEGEPLERGAPVADAALGPAVERLGGGCAILRQGVHLERGDRGEAARRVGEPVAPERVRVAEDGVEVERQRAHRRASHAQTLRPTNAPIASIPTSIGAPWRPRTNAWWISSEAA